MTVSADVDRWIFGEAWTGSQIQDHVTTLCDTIGPRWSGTQAEWQTIDYIRSVMARCGLDRVEVEEFDFVSWSWSRANAWVLADQADRFDLDILPFIRCPSFRVDAQIVDVGFGTQREIDKAGPLNGRVAIMAMAHEPFSEPIPPAYRLRQVAAAGASAAIVIDPKTGGRREYHSAHDSRDPDFDHPPLPCVAATREDAARLRRTPAARIHIDVETAAPRVQSANVHGVLEGELWPEEDLVLGGHHDTVFGTPGGNDNSSGTIAVLETARVLAQLRKTLGTRPGRSIHFVTYAAEEQGFQGASQFVTRHYAAEHRPRLALNLDELSAGPMKGIVLGFEHLRPLVQQQLDTMGDGLACHVMAQLDNSSDHFPYLRRGMDAAHLWRWRFRSRHAEADFHHEPADTADKLNVRELKEYVAQMSRLMLRLSQVEPDAWPQLGVSTDDAAARVEAERGSVVRVF
jgi:hypothetical protein